jgi:hypothetical protein
MRETRRENTRLLSSLVGAAAEGLCPKSTVNAESWRTWQARGLPYYSVLAVPKCARFSLSRFRLCAPQAGDSFLVPSCAAAPQPQTLHDGSVGGYWGVFGCGTPFVSFKGHRHEYVGCVALG